LVGVRARPTRLRRDRATRAEVEHRIEEAIRVHLDLMRESGEPIPQPVTSVGSVDAD
jgi:predicted RNase H-like HicB family nuclease